MKSFIFLKIFVPFHALIIRVTRGRYMSKFRGMEFGTVKTKGVKSGKNRYIPLLLIPYEEGVILVASMGGADVHPSWYWNIKAYPEILIYWKGKELKLFAEQVSDDKKAELWPLICSIYPPYDSYQKGTERNIPVFNCRPNYPK